MLEEEHVLLQEGHVVLQEDIVMLHEGDPWRMKTQKEYYGSNKW